LVQQLAGFALEVGVVDAALLCGPRKKPRL
jgi:hypothetical protein